MQIPPIKIKIAHLNFSLLSSWQYCPVKTYFNYIKPQKVLDDKTLSAYNLRRDIGQCVHAALSAMFLKQDTGAILDKKHKELGLPTDGEGSLTHIDTIVDCYYTKLYNPNIDVVLSESTLERKINDKLYHRGQPDLVINSNGMLTLIDFKTSSDIAKYVFPKASLSYQFPLYISLLRSNGINVSNHIEIHGINTKIDKIYCKKAFFEINQNSIDEADIWFKDQSDSLISSLERGFLTKCGDGNRCFDYFRPCEFLSVCRGENVGAEIENYDYDGFILESY